MAAAAATIILRPSRQRLLVTMVSFTRSRNVSVTSCNYSSSPAPKRQLILYSKPGCCLCDGIKEKLHSAFSLSSPSLDSYSLHDVELQVSTKTMLQRHHTYIKSGFVGGGGGGVLRRHSTVVWWSSPRRKRGEDEMDGDECSSSVGERGKYGMVVE